MLFGNDAYCDHVAPRSCVTARPAAKPASAPTYCTWNDLLTMAGFPTTAPAGLLQPVFEANAAPDLRFVQAPHDM